MAKDLKLIQGTLDVLVMQALASAPRHGFGVAQWIRRSSDDALQIEDGALYNSLHRLERKRYLESEWGLTENNRKAKYYRLTPAGQRHRESCSRTWTRYAEAVSKILRQA